ncbi:putative membrane protein [Bacteroides fragilis str. 3986 N3]|nr:putative membrane protein [Bacteroides fragilis str. 3986 T(B)13]EYE66245.1 putative membrane protein [Bacteroides fragilis str. 3986 N3]
MFQQAISLSSFSPQVRLLFDLIPFAKLLMYIANILINY